LINRTAFVTGATGFLGAFFTVHLLRQGFQVIALVRNAAERSLLPTMEGIGASYPDYTAETLARFSAVDGNVRAVNCGLSNADAEHISATATDVWHFAATFDDQGKGNGDVFATNVGGTDNLLNFLSRSLQPVRLHYVSTAYAAPVESGMAYERLAEPQEATGNEYEMTKAEAERRVVAFCGANGIEHRIYRPPIVAGESTSGLSLGYTGYQGVFRALYLLRRRLEINIGVDFDRDLRLRVVADPELSVNVVPVDFVTAAMWRIAERDYSKGGIFNITTAHSVALAKLFDVASETLGVRGITLSTTHNFDHLPMTMAERLFRRRVQFQEPYFLSCNQFDTDSFRREISEQALPSPTCDSAYLARCNRYCLDDMKQEFAETGEQDRRGSSADTPRTEGLDAPAPSAC